MTQDGPKSINNAVSDKFGCYRYKNANAHNLLAGMYAVRVTLVDVQQKDDGRMVSGHNYRLLGLGDNEYVAQSLCILYI